MSIPLSVYDTLGYLAAGFLILAAAELGYDGTWLVERDWKPGSTALYVTMAYVIGHIVANISSYLIEHRFLRGLLKSPEETLFADEKPSEKCGWREKLFPIFFKPLPKKTQDRILKAAEPEGLNEPGRALFLHAFAVVKSDKVTMDRLNTFLNLYGFCRNMCLAMLIAPVILVTGAARHVVMVGWTDADCAKLLFALVSIAGAVGMLYRYLKFFRHYTIEVLNSYPESKKAKTKTTE